MNNCSGQALTELLGSKALIILTIAGAAEIFYGEWQKSKCAILVFEKTHAQLTFSHDPYPWTRQRVAIKDLGTSLQGEALCGSSREIVSLPKLESAQW